jgi:hypothetical protein
MISGCGLAAEFGRRGDIAQRTRRERGDWEGWQIRERVDLVESGSWPNAPQIPRNRSRIVIVLVLGICQIRR